MLTSAEIPERPEIHDFRPVFIDSLVGVGYDAKNARLRAERAIWFEDVVFHIERDDLLDILEHSNPNRCAGQRIFVVRREDYLSLVPFVKASTRSS